MNGKWMFRLWVLGLAYFALFLCESRLASAAPPWSELISLKSVDAKPDKAYPLSEENGPWMVMACSFSGEGAEKQAQDLVYELRKRYKLPAYTYRGHFDPGEAAGLRRDKFGNALPSKYYKQQKNRMNVEEMAVLIGNYQAVDDAEAQKTLQKVKYAAPQCLEVKEGQKTNQTLTGWRMIQRQVYEAIGSEKKKLGPMGHAFITTNPLLPDEYFAPKNTIDPLIVEMNKNAEFSLLGCPGKYTVRIATFKGQVVIKQNEIKAIEKGEKKMKSSLAAAAEKAHHLAKALRRQGCEAYEFHDRYSSIVTVGSFNSLGIPRADGQIDIDPRIQTIAQKFGAKTTTLPGQDTPVTKLENIDGISLDPQATPIPVPKRSFSTAMRDRE